MDPRAEGSTFHGLPRAFINKRGEPILIHHLDDRSLQRLVAMYLAYQPRNSFQGLPPVRDDACLAWVQGMAKDAINLVALSFESGVVGHSAIFPLDHSRCELLVVVAPAYQNLGIGTELTCTVIQLAYDLGFEAIGLSVEGTNVRARHVYKKCGFTQLGVGASREVEMALDLRRYRDVVNACIGDVMTEDVMTIGPDQPCHKAVELMLAHHLAALPVIEADRRLIGILSQTDLMQPLNIAKHVRDIYSRPVTTVRPNEPITKLIRMFQSSPIRCLPVVNDENRLVGVVSRHEVLAYYAKRLGSG